MKKTASIFFFFFLTAVTAFADMGPKPTMKFNITYEGNRKAHFVQFFQLQYASATDLVPSDSLHEKTQRGPERATCETPEYCRSLAYSYYDFHKLMFVFDDDTLYSPIFQKAAFNSVYNIRVTDSEVIITNVTPWLFRADNPYAFFRALIITLLIELLALWAVLLIFRYPDKKRFLLVVLVANMISLPIFWFLIMGVINSVVGWVIGEIFVFLFESFFIWYMMKKAGSIGKIMMLVFFLNFLSMMAGGAFHFFNMMFGIQMNAWFL